MTGQPVRLRYIAEIREIVEQIRDDVRRQAIREAASVARRACLVPPDGGAPTEEECALCERIARLIEALGEPDAGEISALLPPGDAV